MEFFGIAHKQYAYRRRIEALAEKNTILTVKHGGGSIMLYGCFAASGTGGLYHITGIMKSGDYQANLEQNVFPSVDHGSSSKLRPKAHLQMHAEWLKRKSGLF